MKKNILIIILAVVVLGLGAFIAYDKLLTDHKDLAEKMVARPDVTIDEIDEDLGSLEEEFYEDCDCDCDCGCFIISL